jgi:gamma-glutamylputrescine oxidase
MTKNKPYFIEKAQLRYPERMNLEGNLGADILIVGGGMTGLSTAYALSQKTDPKRISVIDSGRLGFSTTGLSSGLLVDSVEDDFCDVDPQTYREVLAGVNGIVGLIEKEKLDCDLKNIPSFYIATDEKEQLKTVNKEYHARKTNGFNVELIEQGTLRDRHGIQAYLAMKNKTGYCLDPASFCQELAKVLESRGVMLYENTQLNGYNQRTREAEIENGKIRYKKLVLTNSSPTLKNNSFKQRAFLLSTAVAVTHPLTIEQYDCIFRNGEYMLWDAPAVNYMYFRPVGKDRILIGGSDRLVSLSESRKGDISYRKDITDRLNVREIFEKTFPQLKDVQFSNSWTGKIPASIDSIPLIGEIEPDHYIGLYSPGLPNAFRAGELLAELINNEIPDSLDMFIYDRKIPIANKIRALGKYEPFTSIANWMYF